jgi:hypothetical protein
VTNDSKAMDDFHKRSMAGSYAKVLQAASKAGEFWVRYRTVQLGWSEVSSVRLNPDLPGTTSPAKGGLCDRIRHWAASADIHAGGLFVGFSETRAPQCSVTVDPAQSL